MTLSKRKKLPKGSTYAERQVENGGLSGLLKDNPLLFRFSPNVGDTPKDLVNYLIALQKKNLGTIVEIPFNGLIRNVKILLKEFDPLMIKRGIKLASDVAEHPFSFGFVERMIRERIKDELDPVQPR